MQIKINLNIKVWLLWAIPFITFKITNAQQLNWWSVALGSGQDYIMNNGDRWLTVHPNRSILLSKNGKKKTYSAPYAIVKIDRNGTQITKIPSYRIEAGDTIEFGPRYILKDSKIGVHLLYDPYFIRDSCYLGKKMLPPNYNDSFFYDLHIDEYGNWLNLKKVWINQWPGVGERNIIKQGRDGYLIMYFGRDTIYYQDKTFPIIPSSVNYDFVLIKVDTNWNYQWHLQYQRPVIFENMAHFEMNADSTEYLVVWQHNEKRMASPSTTLYQYFVDRVSLDGQIIESKPLLPNGTFESNFFDISPQGKMHFVVRDCDENFSLSYSKDVGFNIPYDTDPFNGFNSFIVEIDLKSGEIVWSFDLSQYNSYNVSLRHLSYNQWGDKFITTSIKDTSIIYNTDSIKILKEGFVISQFIANDETMRLVLESDRMGGDLRPMMDKYDNLHINSYYFGSSIYLNDSFIIDSLGKGGYLDMSFPFRHLSFKDSLTCTDLNLRYTTNAKVPFDSIWWQVNGVNYGSKRNLQLPASLNDTFKLKLFGAYNGFADTIIREKIIVQKRPIDAAFSFSDTAFCQFKELAFYPKVAVHSDYKEEVQYDWSIYNKTQKLFTSIDSIAKWKASISEPVVIKLKAGNGYCNDTFSVTDSIVIEPAPQGGFKLEFSELCAPAEVVVVDTSIGSIDNRIFEWSDGQVFKESKFTTTFDSSGLKKITQTLTGPTGCTTKDSQWVRIRPGFTKNDSTEMLSASVLDSHLVLLKLKTNPNAMGYSVIRQQKGQNFWPVDVFGHAQDSIIDTVPYTTRTTQYQYFVRMGDSCYNLSKESNHASTIVLSRINYNNQYVVLTWNAYEKWYGGVREYVIESSENKQDWLPIDASGQLSYPDYRLPQLQSDTVYYRIKAIEQNGNQQHSYSNVVKVPVNTTLFIPNAFSPNGDGVNDIFKIGHFGLKEFECKIYSSTGQIVSYSTNPDEIWDGEFNELPYPTGNYRYVIKAIDQKGKELLYEGTLVLIR